MGEYIEREALYKTLTKEALHLLKFEKDGKSRGVRLAMQTVKKAPAADVAPAAHGKWMTTEKGKKCSNCNCRSSLFDQNLESCFCPWCGAKMDLEEDAELTLTKNAEENV